ELIEVGLADEQRPGIDQTLSSRRRLARCVRVLRAPGGGGKSGDVDVVLDGKKLTGQRQVRSARDACRDRGTVLQHVSLSAERNPDLGPVNFADPCVGGSYPVGNLHSSSGANTIKVVPALTCVPELISTRETT